MKTTVHMENPTPVIIKDRAAWRSWLSKNHRTKKEVWLVYGKKQSGINSVSCDDAVEEAICFGWIDGQVRAVDEGRYMQRFSPRKPASRWSELNIARAKKMIGAGLMKDDGRTVFEDAMQKNRIVPSQSSFSVPGELEQALSTNATAAENFRHMAPTHRRMYSAYVDMAKKDETRQKRIAKCVELLEENKKLTDVFGIKRR
jgi:uncharacterized protein YdeI (YjbR/CyaY-like superfamily)